MSQLAPVPPRERVVTLDVLRGFALCGVLIGNMALYSGQWAEQHPASPTRLDEITDWILMLFVHSKAQTLLTLLFGFGFATQLLRAQERREPVMGLYVRRLVVLFVLGWLVLLMQRPAWRRMLRVVAPVGRMPLTTYYSHSLICTLLFYGFGLGWAGTVGVAGCTGLALAIFGVQIVVSQLWLRAFRFGPLEWAWRSAVYLKLPPMRVAGSAGADRIGQAALR